MSVDRPLDSSVAIFNLYGDTFAVDGVPQFRIEQGVEPHHIQLVDHRRLFEGFLQGVPACRIEIGRFDGQVNIGGASGCSGGAGAKHPGLTNLREPRESSLECLTIFLT